MDTPPKNEPDTVRQAVRASVLADCVSDDLAVLVHGIARRRTTERMAEDIAQHVLMGLVRHLKRLQDERDTYHYICTAISNTWHHIMRGRKVERRGLIVLSRRIVNELPVCARPTASRQMMASADRVFRLKYY